MQKALDAVREQLVKQRAERDRLTLQAHSRRHRPAAAAHAADSTRKMPKTRHLPAWSGTPMDENLYHP